MTRRPFFWHIFPATLLISIITGAVIAIYATRTFESYHLDRTVSALRVQAQLLRDEVSRTLVDSTVSADSLCKEIGRRTGTRLTVIRADGKVLGDSHENPAEMDNHRDRPEIMQALAGGPGVATRYSETMDHKMMYVAIPIEDRGTLLAVTRTSLPLVTVSETFSAVSSRVALALVIVSLAAIGLSMALSRRLSRPIEELRQGALRLASGDLDTPLPTTGTREAAELASAMNTMARQLHERIQDLIHQRNEQETILASMVEGVVAVDNDERILLVNAAAQSMLGIEGREMRGRLLQEAVRNVELQRFLLRLAQQRRPAEVEISAIMPGGVKKTLEVHGNVLGEPGAPPEGVLVVLHDVTRLKKLENIRRDFVANVSHELRTPLTSIKGFVETLQHGTDDSPDERRRFLDIIANHVNRLNTIIEDLLTISRLEKDSVGDEIKLESVSLDALVKDAADVCEGSARKKGISIVFEGQSGITAKASPSLLEQALIDLVDNAIKYGDQESTIRIRCEQGEREISLAVVDEGPGIEAKHLSRLFERFYRIDKARSRKLGGTGLGLAIVKHILQLHHGSVDVQSELGTGSTFTLRLPKQPEKENA